MILSFFFRGKRGIRTPGASQHAGFQDRCNRPLYHLSNAFSSKAVQSYCYFLFLQMFFGKNFPIHTFL